jgi:hypothetical protein
MAEATEAGGGKETSAIPTKSFNSLLCDLIIVCTETMMMM